MNAKKAKQIRQKLRASNIDVREAMYTRSNNGSNTHFLEPESPRSIYRRLKELGLGELA